MRCLGLWALMPDTPYSSVLRSMGAETDDTLNSTLAAPVPFLFLPTNLHVSYRCRHPHGAAGSLLAAINQPFFSGGMSKRLHVLEGSNHN